MNILHTRENQQLSNIWNTGKADLHLCCRACIACRHQCTRWLQPSGAGAGPAGPEGWSHRRGTGSATQGTKGTDKQRAPGPGVLPEAPLALGRGCRAAGKEQQPGCRGSGGSGSAGTGGSGTIGAAAAASGAAGQCQFVKVKCMAPSHSHTSLDQWDFCFCF